MSVSEVQTNNKYILYQRFLKADEVVLRMP